LTTTVHLHLRNDTVQLDSNGHQRMLRLQPCLARDDAAWLGANAHQVWLCPQLCCMRDVQQGLTDVLAATDGQHDMLCVKARLAQVVVSPCSTSMGTWSPSGISPSSSSLAEGGAGNGTLDRTGR